MEREKIKLTNSQWRDLVWENYLVIDGKEIKITNIKEEYHGSSRHTEQHSLIFQRKSDSKYFNVNYETSVKDSMGWKECNYGDTEATEVFPETVTTIIYK